MVKKLYKYEFRSYLLWNLLIYAAVIASAIVLRLTLLIAFEGNRLTTLAFEESNFLTDALFFASIAIYFITVCAGFTLVVIMPIVRFYKNMLSSEGYLTLSIPVTPTTHIVAKTVVAYVYMIGQAVAFCLSVGIILIGWEDSAEILKNIGEIFSEMVFYINEEGPGIVASCVAFLITCILSPIATLMMYYFCLSMGMLFGKYKIVGSVIIYIALQMAYSILGGVFEIILMPFAFVIESEIVLILTLSIGILLFTIAQICIYFGFTNHMFKHKVNI